MAFEETGLAVTSGQVDLIPIGTIAEAEAEGLDPTRYATCARPNPVMGVIGCKRFDKCVMSAKGVSGPRNYGLRVFKGPSQGGGMVNQTNSCLWVADHKGTIERNGGAIKVIAEEGETYTKVTGMAVDNMTGAPTMNVRDPNTHRKDVQIEVEVGAWPRPGENPALIHDLLRAEVTVLERKRKSDESLARNEGNLGAIAPLDKRDAGSASGRSKAGK